MTAPVNCAFDTDLIGRNRSGNETFLRGLLHGMAEVRKLDLILIGGDPSALRQLSQEVSGRYLPAPSGPIGELGFGLRARRSQADVAITTYNAALGFPGLKATIVHDVSFKRFPHTFPRTLRTRITASVARSVRVSDLIITVSEFSKAELLEVYPRLTPDEVVVIYNAPASEFVPPSDDEIERVQVKYALPREFVLAVGNVQPRKNLPRLAEATRSLGTPLVVVGQALWLNREVISQYGDGVQPLGYVPQSDLPALYGASSVFAYPSLYEGYGLPVIEAMSCGVPVVTSNNSSLCEIAGDAAELVDAESVTSIASGLARVLDSAGHQQKLIEAGLIRAAQFTWRASAERLTVELCSRT